MNYCFDIDGTICTTGCDYNDSVPYVDVIDKINNLYDDGHHIEFFTSRGTKSGKDWKSFTLKQLRSWEVKFHKLTMGKPHYDLFIDDRCINNDEWYLKEGISL